MCLPSLKSLFTPPEITIPKSPLAIPAAAPVAPPIQTQEGVKTKGGRRRFKSSGSLGIPSSSSGLGLPPID